MLEEAKYPADKSDQAKRENSALEEEVKLMPEATMIMYEEEYHQIKAILSKLRTDANAKVVFLIDKNGQQIASHGDIGNLDTTSLASLTAGNVAATDGLARLIGEKEFPVLSHEGEKDNIHISVVGSKVILVVLFDERSSLGLVRLRVKRASSELNEAFDQMLNKAEQARAAGAGANTPFSEISDDDIDRLFSDDML